MQQQSLCENPVLLDGKFKFSQNKIPSLSLTQDKSYRVSAPCQSGVALILPIGNAADVHALHIASRCLQLQSTAV